jgi:hypothetical protein
LQFAPAQVGFALPVAVSVPQRSLLCAVLDFSVAVSVYVVVMLVPVKASV